MKKRSLKSGICPDSEVEWNLTLPEKQKKIAVVGISRGAGATFVAVSLAFLLSRSNSVEKCRRRLVTYAEGRKPEPGNPLVFYETGLDQRKSGLLRAFGEKRDPLVLPIYKGISWQVWRPFADDFRMAQGEFAGDWTVTDCPPLNSLEEYDLIAAVIDPMPAAVYAGAETYAFLRDLERSGKKIIWIVNRDNDEVNHGELKRFLKLRDWFSLPLIPAELFYKAQYSCMLPAELLEKESLPQKALETIAEEILRELHRKQGMPGK